MIFIEITHSLDKSEYIEYTHHVVHSHTLIYSYSVREVGIVGRYIPLQPTRIYYIIILNTQRVFDGFVAALQNIYISKIR